MADSVTRTFRLTGLDANLIAALESMSGVLHVRQVGKSKLRVTYDVTETDYRALQEKLRKSGSPRPDNWLEHLRSEWNQFKDENLRAHAAHKPACCSKPPPGASRR